MAVGGTHRAYSLLLFPLYDALLQTHKMVSDIYRYRHHPCVRVVPCRVCRVSCVAHTPQRCAEARRR
jgi:hypothetical protein